MLPTGTELMFKSLKDIKIALFHSRSDFFLPDTYNKENISNVWVLTLYQAPMGVFCHNPMR